MLAKFANISDHRTLLFLHHCDVADFLLAGMMRALIHMDYFIYNALEIVYNNFIEAKTLNNNSWWWIVWLRSTLHDVAL